jgi:DNA-binding NarL/FixJ family response regulator
MRESPARASTGESETPSRCRILLVEDDEPIRERLARVIGAWPRGELLAACSTLAEAAAVIDSRRVDLLVTDLKLPDGHGVQAIRLLRAERPEAEAMVISALADDRSVIEAIEAGASGYLLKDSDPIDILDAIADLLAGRSPISSTIARTIIRRISGRAPTREQDAPAAAERLTPREMDILRGIAKGLTYAELAAHLQISRQTVPAHIKNVYRKLQSNNRSEAVFEASRRGLIRL